MTRVWSVNIVFVEPSFPRNQRRFVQALASVGANVIGVGETPEEWLEPDVRDHLSAYYQVSNVTDVHQLDAAVRWAQDKAWVDGLESTIESHQMAAAQVREWRGVPGTSVRTTWLCRDKPSMKEALRQAGVPTAASTAADSADEVREFARRIGYPLILKPRDGAGALGTTKVSDDTELEAAIGSFGGARSIAVEEFVEGHEGFYDTISSGGHVQHDWMTHYYRPRGDAAPVDLAAVHHDQPHRRLRLLRRGPRDGPAGHRGPRHRHERDPHGVVRRTQGPALQRDRLPSPGRRRVGPLLGGQ